MTQQEIKKKIDENNRRIEAIFNPGVFVLNEEIKKLQEEIRDLQAQCAHEYDNGLCIYCQAREGDN